MSTLTLRPLQSDDLPRLARWLAEPHVRRWWGDPDRVIADAERRCGGMPGPVDRTELFVLEEDARPVGMVQRYRIADDPGWMATLAPILDVAAAAGIDYLIGEPDAVGRGVGARAIALTVEAIYADWAVTSVVVDVPQENRASWRALQKAGFSRAWAGTLPDDDPPDHGPAFLYVHRRPG